MTTVSAPENTAPPQLEANGEQCQSGQERSLSPETVHGVADYQLQAIDDLRAYARIVARRRKQELERAHFRGESARGRYMRVSPYYEDPGADVFWYAGFDGLSLEEAAVLHDAALGRAA